MPMPVIALWEVRVTRTSVKLLNCGRRDLRNVYVDATELHRLQFVIIGFPIPDEMEGPRRARTQVAAPRTPSSGDGPWMRGREDVRNPRAGPTLVRIRRRGVRRRGTRRARDSGGCRMAERPPQERNPRIRHESGGSVLVQSTNFPSGGSLGTEVQWPTYPCDLTHQHGPIFRRGGGRSGSDVGWKRRYSSLPAGPS